MGGGIVGDDDDGEVHNLYFNVFCVTIIPGCGIKI